MAIPKHFVLTLNGASQNLATALGLDSATGRNEDADLAAATILLQAAGANVNPIFVGFSTVSSTDYGVRIPTPVTGVPEAPFALSNAGEGRLRLRNIFVIGTNNEKLHILLW